jgi:penicillin amidase
MDETWWDDVATVESESRREIVLRALDRIDGQRLRRPWGELHGLRFVHPFKDLPVVGPLLGRSWSRGPYPVAGDGTTVNAHYWSRRRPFRVVAIPSMRFVADVGDWDATVLVLPPGQSGRPWSMHYADQLGAWLWVEARRQPFTDEAVERAARARLILRP